jgi:hypothetical protein
VKPEAKAGEPKPGEPKPGEPKPGEPKPGETPATVISMMSGGRERP